jgi:hypothetical protein
MAPGGRTLTAVVSGCRVRAALACRQAARRAGESSTPVACGQFGAPVAGGNAGTPVGVTRAVVGARVTPQRQGIPPVPGIAAPLAVMPRGTRAVVSPGAVTLVGRVVARGGAGEPTLAAWVDGVTLAAVVPPARAHALAACLVRLIVPGSVVAAVASGRLRAKAVDVGDPDSVSVLAAQPGPPLAPTATFVPAANVRLTALRSMR